MVTPPATVRPEPVRPAGTGGSDPGGRTPGSGDHRPVNQNENRKQAQSRGNGCVVFLAICLILVGVFFLTAKLTGTQLFGGTGITPSTVRREPLPAGSVNETGYYTDTLGWIGNEERLLQGMRYFYEKTGVQPYLYITDSVNGSHFPSQADLEDFAEGLYDRLFTDEAHLLLVFFEYGGYYMTRGITGVQAKTVIDSEAGDILLDYLDRYYYNENLSDEEYFSKAFHDAADRIMTVHRSPWIPVFITIGVGIVMVTAYAWWTQAQARKEEEARRTEEILKTPLERFGNIEAEELAKKYENMDGGAPPAQLGDKRAGGTDDKSPGDPGDRTGGSGTKPDDNGPKGTGPGGTGSEDPGPAGV